MAIQPPGGIDEGSPPPNKCGPIPEPIIDPRMPVGGGGTGGGGCNVCPDIRTVPGCDDGCEPGDQTSMMTAGCGGKCEGSTCLAEGAMVLMGDGTARAVESLDVHDRVAGIDPAGIARDQLIKRVTRAWGRLLEVVHGGGSFFCTHSHVVFTHDGSAVRVDELDPSAHRLTTPEGEPIEIFEVKSGGEGIVIALEVSPDHVFMAEGVRHHNKIQGPPL